MESLPADLIALLIVKYVPPTDSVKCLRVCKRWLRAVMDRQFLAEIHHRVLLSYAHYCFFGQSPSSTWCVYCGRLVYSHNLCVYHFYYPSPKLKRHCVTCGFYHCKRECPFDQVSVVQGEFNERYNILYESINRGPAYVIASNVNRLQAIFMVRKRNEHLTKRRGLGERLLKFVQNAVGSFLSWLRH